MFGKYDVIVVGAGHAGCEAASAAAKRGSRVLLVTMNLQTVAQMSCNPAMGGVAKGQIVREIDALGGFSGRATDRSSIQFRMLNLSKGPGVWSPRAQCDRMLFAQMWREYLESLPTLHFWQDTVASLIVSRGTVTGVVTSRGERITAKSVVLTSGTFMNGVIHIGDTQAKGGRIGESRSEGITEQLMAVGFASSRLKTGTPPRVDGRSLDYSKMGVQEGDAVIRGFSYWEESPLKSKAQRCCWIAHTNDRVHNILKTGFDRSPMYTGRIEGAGPRYCPSVEDKVSRFADKTSHQLFVEPEGWNTVEIYVNGFSTSLPAEVQFAALREVPGFEEFRAFRPGYAIEYDYFPPDQLQYTLQTKGVKNLFFAGQINGTTGYEEAAGQGLVAGINAHSAAHDLEPLVLGRDQAYIGVLIDDLISKGTDEPYRMFTSRAEYRTLLRQDNADVRLAPIGYSLGLITAAQLNQVNKKRESIRQLSQSLKTLRPALPETADFLEGIGEKPVGERVSAEKLLLRPKVSLPALAAAVSEVGELCRAYDDVLLEQVEIELKYATYIQKEAETAQRMKEMEGLQLPRNFDYSKLTALSIEARQKLLKIQPETLGQATRISGVNPSDIQILMVHMGR